MDKKEKEGNRPKRYMHKTNHRWRGYHNGLDTNR